MTREDILSQLVIDREYRFACDRISGYSQLAEELFQEMCEVMCRLDDTQLFSLNAQGSLRWFVVRVLVKMWRYPSSPFYQRHRKPLKDKSEWNPELLQDRDEEYNLDLDAEESYKLDVTHGVLEEKKNSGNRGDFYDAMIFEIYMRAGSSRKAEKETKIPYRTIATSVRRTRMLIVGKVKLSSPNK